MDTLLTLSATRLAELIRSRQATSRDILERHIARIEAVNPALNAVVAKRYTEARFEADAADARVLAGEEGLPPFHGVPCTIKECFSLTGMPHSAGLVARKHVRATSDATTVARVRAAGAIPMGVTNTSELCMWMETNNRLYGRTNNPYDVSRIVGGSSGGEGAIVGSGASPFGLGSDIGGSIRMPAFFCGVFGHKPSGGMVPGTGQFPLAENDALRYLTTGPLCRRAEDLMPLLHLLAGPDGEDARCERMPLGDPTSVDWTRMRVLDVRENGILEPDVVLQMEQEHVARHFEKLGAKVERRVFPQLESSLEIWSAMLDAAGGTSFAALLGEGKPIESAWQLARWFLRASPHTLPAIVLALIEKVPHLMPGRAKELVQQGIDLRGELQRELGEDGILLFPSYPHVAPKHYSPLIPPIGWAYTAIINVLQLPATQVPMGLGGDGLPLGLQVIAAHGFDHLTIAAALELERAFGGWVPPHG